MEKEKQSGWKNLMERLNIKYRLVILDDSTLEEKLSFKLSRMNMYLTISTLVVLSVLLTVFVIISTPLKQYIPGYQDVSLRRDLMKLNTQSDSLNMVVASQARYIDAFRNVFDKDLHKSTYTNPEEIETSISPENDYSDIDLDKVSEEESMVRESVEREMAYTLSDNKQTGEGLRKNFFMRPMEGFISRGFEPENEHFGLDIGSQKEDAQVMAVADGTVILNNWTMDTGHIIAIQHANNLVSFYKHNSVILKKVGNFVKAGDAIAILGNSGELTNGPHLHFELWYNQTPVDPLDYINL